MSRAEGRAADFAADAHVERARVCQGVIRVSVGRSALFEAGAKRSPGTLGQFRPEGLAPGCDRRLRRARPRWDPIEGRIGRDVGSIEDRLGVGPRSPPPPTPGRASRARSRPPCSSPGPSSRFVRTDRARRALYGQIPLISAEVPPARHRARVRRGSSRVRDPKSGSLAWLRDSGRYRRRSEQLSRRRRGVAPGPYLVVPRERPLKSGDVRRRVHRRLPSSRSTSRRPKSGAPPAPPRRSPDPGIGTRIGTPTQP
jgi:hypothetical protein